MRYVGDEKRGRPREGSAQRQTPTCEGGPYSLTHEADPIFDARRSHDQNGRELEKDVPHGADGGKFIAVGTAPVGKKVTNQPGSECGEQQPTADFDNPRVPLGKSPSGNQPCQVDQERETPPRSRSGRAAVAHPVPGRSSHTRRTMHWERTEAVPRGADRMHAAEQEPITRTVRRPPRRCRERSIGVRSPRRKLASASPRRQYTLMLSRASAPEPAAVAHLPRSVYNVLWEGRTVSGLIDLGHAAVGDLAVDVAPLIGGVRCGGRR